MPLLIRRVLDTAGLEWVVRKLSRESARLGRGTCLRCYATRGRARGLKLDVYTDGAWEELSDAELLAVIARSRAPEPPQQAATTRP
jgi:hypothetical protein